MKEKKKGGGKLNRTETVTLRLDPKLRYLTELAARTQRRTTSGFIEWAIQNSLSKVELYSDFNNVIMLSDKAEKLWDIEEADRFALLALKFPNLLLHKEQVIWKMVTENTAFWEQFNKDNLTKPIISEGSLNRKILRKYWEILNLVAEGKADLDELPDTEDIPY